MTYYQNNGDICELGSNRDSRAVTYWTLLSFQLSVSKERKMNRLVTGTGCIAHESFLDLQDRIKHNLMDRHHNDMDEIRLKSI